MALKVGDQAPDFELRSHRGGTVKLSDFRGKRQVVVTSIPYTVNKATLIEQIAAQILERKLPQVVDVRDESTTDVRIVLELKTDAEPEVAMAAVRVLERAGMDVEIPHRPLCCGRPLFDYGMLDTARAWLGDVIDALRPALDAGMPVVGLEPSCVAVFRDEVLNLFPDAPDFRRLAQQTCTFAEFLDRHTHKTGSGDRAGEEMGLVQGHRLPPGSRIDEGRSDVEMWPGAFRGRIVRCPVIGHDLIEPRTPIAANELICVIIRHDFNGVSIP